MRRSENQRQREQRALFWTLVMRAIAIYNNIRRKERLLRRAPHRNWQAEREIALFRLYGSSDRVCHEQLRMNIPSFNRFCTRMRTYGLVDSRSGRVEEQVAIFLNTIGHDERNIAETFTFFRFGQTVSYYFHRVLHACLALYRDVVTNATPENSPFENGNNYDWYHYFEDAVGAIDGTHIAANVPVVEQGRYRNRKQVISQNVLVACTFTMKFTYVLAGLEGSAHDGRLLRCAIQREGHRLTIPLGKYYLADAGFPLVPGFLAPYRKTRYHRRDIEGQRPENSRELFNFRHSSLRNAVERTIGLLKKRFAYLRHQPFHDINTQVKIVLACCAIHNFLRIEDEEDVCNEDPDVDDGVTPTPLDVPEVAPTNAEINFVTQAAWTERRNVLATLMWAEYDATHHEAVYDD